MTEKTEDARPAGKRGAHPVLFYGAMIIAAFIAGVLIFNFLVLPLLVGRGDIAIVPDLDGMQVSPAEDVCAERGLNLMVTGERHSVEYPAGTVMEQHPGSGPLFESAGRCDGSERIEDRPAPVDDRRAEGVSHAGSHRNGPSLRQGYAGEVRFPRFQGSEQEGLGTFPQYHPFPEPRPRAHDQGGRHY